jgi:nucleotide-binding universal stress UspA family protein
MFNKILVPLDGSEWSARVLTEVAELAKIHNAQVTLMHVCHTLDFGVGEASPGVIQETSARQEKACDTFLGKAANDLRNLGISVDYICVEGSPVREIIDYATKNGMGLIAMATHGAGEVAWAMGSTAERIVTHSPVPVLLFRVMEAKAPELKPKFQIKEEHFATPGVGTP